MKALFICLLAFMPILSFAQLRAPAVRSYNGKTGVVTVQAVEFLCFEHTFTSEKLSGDYETIGVYPANAKMLGGYYSMQPGYVWQDPDAMTLDIGFPGLDNEISYGLQFHAYESSTPIFGNFGRKFSVPTDIRIKHGVNTVNMTGNRLDLCITYMQE